jgi:uncharacterized iron-regulated membrane protein
MRARQALVRLHRWVGLGLAGFLVVVGLTGAAIAWNDELERVCAPALFVLPQKMAPRPALDPFALREAAERAAPGFAVNGVDFTRKADEPARFFVEAKPGGPAPANDEIALDPSTGRLLGARRDGDLRQGVVNLMPFIYSLHDSLALGDGGALVLGFVALAWTIDCFIGAWLTLPVRARGRRPLRRWLSRWRHAWTIRRPTTPFKLTFDLHSAGGLWLWGLLLVLAWSSVAFNLPAVYRPVTQALFGVDAEGPLSRAPVRLQRPPALDWRKAHAVAQVAMAAEAQRFGFSVRAERLMVYDPAARTYAYRVKSSLDPGKLGNTQITLDADDGRAVAFSRPTGGRLGTTLTTWIDDLHTAGVFGWPMQVLISLTGVTVSGLSVTGVLIWMRKRRANRRRHRVSPERFPPQDRGLIDRQASSLTEANPGFRR